ncbi:MAG: AmmeMemoRadiSam system protein B [Desulfamplus sp.]|nr:AmmeMemoRadiSam system protein B [Desulfamplus sp.]
MEIKKTAFAGSWYPDNARECKEQIEQFLTEKDGPSEGRFAGGIVPHAGWFFSGSIACRVIASIARSLSSVSALKPSRKIDVVFVFGMHMHPGSMPCVMVNGAWQTPFGNLYVHERLAVEFAANSELAANSKVYIKKETPDSFPEENTIELQLPFVKYFFPEAAIVPVGVPPCDVAGKMGIAAVESAKKLGLDIVVLGSTDMTHYGSNYGFAPAGSGRKALDWVKSENDPKAVSAMCSLNSSDIIFQGLKNKNLCCAGAVAAAASAAKKMGAVRGVELDYATSYDKSPGASFVGYSGILFSY